MKSGRQSRELMVQEYKKRLTEAEFLFFTRFRAVSADGMCQIRAKLKQNSSDMIVVKNSLFRRTLQELQMDKLLDYVEDDLAVVYGLDNPVRVARQIQELSKIFEGFSASAALVQEHILDSKAVKSLALIPSRDVLYAQIVNLIKAPISNLVFILKGNIQSLLSVLKQIKEKKES